MLRMIGTKLKEWIKGMKDRIHPGDGEGDVEIGGDLEVDGNIYCAKMQADNTRVYSDGFDVTETVERWGAPGQYGYTYMYKVKFRGDEYFNFIAENSPNSSSVDRIAIECETLNFTTVSGDPTKFEFEEGWTVSTTPRQPAIAHEGAISEASTGSPAVGTYTLKYTPTYDLEGNIVGGAGTLAIELTRAPTTKTLYLTSSSALPKLTGILNSAGSLLGVACDGQLTGTNAYGFTLANLLGGDIATGAYEGGINIASN